jgi:hypothetical protein
MRWDTIEYGDLVTLFRELRTLREKVGRPVIYIAVQDDAYREPRAEVSQALKLRFNELMKVIKTNYVVIRATGIQASFQRRFLKTVLTAGRLAGIADLDRVVILATVEEVLRLEAADLPAPASEIIAELRRNGVLPAKTYL